MDSPHTSIIAPLSTITLAGVGTGALLEWMPKSAIVAIAITAITIVGFFVKRDYQRLNDHMTTANVRMMSVEGFARNAVTVDQHRESITGVHRKIDALFERLELQVDDKHTRIVVLETKAGLREGVE